MDPRDILRQQFLETVENQLRDNDPPETRRTLQRLMADGYSEAAAKDLIAACVSAEIFTVMKENRPYDEKRYVGWLDRLPELPE